MTDTQTQLGQLDETTQIPPSSETIDALAWEHSNDDETRGLDDSDDVKHRSWRMTATIAVALVGAGTAIAAGIGFGDHAATRPTAAATQAPAPAPWSPPPMPHGSYKATGIAGSSVWAGGSNAQTMQATDPSVEGYEEYKAPNCSPSACTLIVTAITDTDVIHGNDSGFHYDGTVWREDAPVFYEGSGYKVQLDTDIVAGHDGRWRQQNLETVVSCPESGCGDLPLGATMRSEVLLTPTFDAA